MFGRATITLGIGPNSSLIYNRPTVTTTELRSVKLSNYRRIACDDKTQEQKMSEMIHVKVRLAQGADTYVIRDVSADDEGRYFCRATNAFGVKEASVDVRMLGKRRLFPVSFHPATTSAVAVRTEPTDVSEDLHLRLFFNRCHSSVDESVSKVAQSGV